MIKTRVRENLAERLLALAVASGSDPDASWAFAGPNELERMRLFRHAAPESVFQSMDRLRQQDPRLHWIGMDIHLGRGTLQPVMEMCAEDLAARGLKAALFGHGADRLLHGYALPRNHKQFDRGKALVARWARKISAMGGEVLEQMSGKVNHRPSRLIPLPACVQLLHEVKRQLDPAGVWNCINLPADQEVAPQR